MVDFADHVNTTELLERRGRERQPETERETRRTNRRSCSRSFRIIMLATIPLTNPTSTRKNRRQQESSTPEIIAKTKPIPRKTNPTQRRSRLKCHQLKSDAPRLLKNHLQNATRMACSGERPGQNHVERRHFHRRTHLAGQIRLHHARGGDCSPVLAADSARRFDDTRLRGR